MTVTMTGPYPNDLFIPSVATISSVQGCPTTPRVAWKLISYNPSSDTIRVAAAGLYARLVPINRHNRISSRHDFLRNTPRQIIVEFFSA